jgi:thiol-disulfide isomerase/thioredoxin
VRGPWLPRAMGLVMVLTALAVATDRDVAFQTAIADDLPSFAVNPTGSLERSGTVSRRLDDLRPQARFAARGPGLPVLGPAPEFEGIGRWIDSPPLTMRSLRGRVVLVDFWTYTCINCLRTLPYLRAWDERYRDRGLTIVGVHTPEFAFERDTANVRDAIARNHLRYPVAQDNRYETWNAWGNVAWPAKYLVDTRGRVRYVHLGEGEYDETERAIRALLPRRDLGPPAGRQPGEVPGEATPETYLGAARAERWVPPVQPGVHDYPGATSVPLHHFALGGRWNVDDESAEALGDATLTAHVTAKSVYLVLSSRGGRARRVDVSLDGRRLRPVVVRRQRLYRLVALPRTGEHVVRLHVAPGVAGYAFTFG